MLEWWNNGILGGCPETPSFHYSTIPFFHYSNKPMRYFLLTILSLSLACPVELLFYGACAKQPTSPDTFSLAGTVHLEGQKDHSGVTVALYNLVEPDTAVVRMQKEFPFVGVPISQQTEFDHRLEETVYTKKTKTDDSFHFSLHSQSNSLYLYEDIKRHNQHPEGVARG
jgi:hypothetical protein